MNEVSSIQNAILKGEFAPVYLLMGEEPYFIDQISNLLLERVVEESARDFDSTIFYGKETHPDQILEAAKRYPMLGAHQLVVVREAQYLDRSLDKLTDYCTQPQPQTVLVLCYKYKKIDQRKKIAKAIANSGVVFTSKPLYDDKIPSWIATRSKQYQLDFTPQSSGMLASYLGSDLGKIDRELEKLSLAVPAQSQISPELIEQHIGFSKSFNAFELQKALGVRDLQHAFRIVQYIAQNPNQHPFVLIVSTLFSFFQKLFMYHSLSSKAEAAKTLGVHPFFIRDYEKAAQKFTLKQTAQVFTILKEIDLKSKGVGANNYRTDELLKEMVLKIVSA